MEISVLCFAVRCRIALKCIDWCLYSYSTYRRRARILSTSYTHKCVCVLFFCWVCFRVCSSWASIAMRILQRKGIICKMNHNADQSTKLMFIVVVIFCCPSLFFATLLRSFPAIYKNIGFVLFESFKSKHTTDEISKKFQFHAVIIGIFCFGLPSSALIALMFNNLHCFANFTRKKLLNSLLKTDDGIAWKFPGNFYNFKALL